MAPPRYDGDREGMNDYKATTAYTSTSDRSFNTDHSPRSYSSRPSDSPSSVSTRARLPDPIDYSDLGPLPSDGRALADAATFRMAAGQGTGRQVSTSRSLDEALSNNNVTKAVPSGQSDPKAIQTGSKSPTSLASIQPIASTTADLADQAEKTQTSLQSEQQNIDEEDWPAPKPIDEDAIIAARRKRRAEIIAKYAKEEQPLLHKVLQPTAIGADSTIKPAIDTNVTTSQQLGSPSSPAGFSDANSPQSAGASDQNGKSEQEMSAADYVPQMDMTTTDEIAQNAAKSSAAGAHVCADAAHANPAKATAVKPKVKEYDMFASESEEEDDDDMFAGAPVDGKTEKSGAAKARVEGKVLGSSMQDSWDDPNGHYRVILGELLDGRYAVRTKLGEGVSGRVVRAVDTSTNTEYAIKITRTQDQMRKSSLAEMAWMRKLAEADPDDKRHILRLHGNFEHKGHLCIVLESLNIDLREVLRKFGRDTGLHMSAVRAYAQQMFLGLSLLAKCEIIHADLKPDNMLIAEEQRNLKIADFGSAIAVRDIQVTEELVSRYYRAPEIMLGIKGDPALDMWSVGCTLFELCTGKICFTGTDNNQMLRQIMESRGKIPVRMLKKAAYWQQHFDLDGAFLSKEFDKITQRAVVRKPNMSRTVAGRDIRSRVLASMNKTPSPAETAELNLFADLLDKCLTLDPIRRITPNDALKHEFITRVSAKIVKKV